MPSWRARRSRLACPKASTLPAISTLTSTSISMALPKSNLLIALTVFATASLSAQTVTPLRLSFAGAVREATGGGTAPDTAPAIVEIATFRTDAANARVRQVRAGLLPSLSLAGSWVNRNFNPKTLGFNLPGLRLPSMVPAFNVYDGRARVTETLFDFSNHGRDSAAKSQVTAASADRSAAVETSAQTVALAYARAARAQAVVAAGQADSALAAELVGLAVAQAQAGVSASIDVTRAKTQLAEAAGQLVVAANQLDRAKIDLARALGRDPSTRIALTDTLSAQLGVADVPADRNAAVAQAIAVRPDLRAELARGAAARTASAAVSEARQRFKAGVAGNIEVITAQSSLLRARDADIDARFSAMSARIALARSVGAARTLH